MAYYTAADPNGPTIEAAELVRSSVEPALPDYMVPAAYVADKSDAADREREVRQQGLADAGR